MLFLGKISFSKYFLIFSAIIQTTLSHKVPWDKLMPQTCVNHLNFSLPDYPIEVNVSVRVVAIYDISEEKMEFGMQFHLLEIWKDPFIVFPEFKDGERIVSKLVPKQITDCIWKPDTVFKNVKTIIIYHDYAPNIYYKLVQPGNKIVRRSRFKVTASCPMKFGYYPMDSQKCSLDITTDYSRKSDVNMQWSQEFSSSITDRTPLNFAITSLPKTKSQTKSSRVTSISETLHANFLFERSISASLFNTYIPSFLVVCLSMVSFWLDVDAVPGRVTLGVTAILTLSTQIVQARSSLPVLDYMTAMDVWLLGCLLVVFLSLIEFTFAHSYSRKLKRSKVIADKPIEETTAAWTDGEKLPDPSNKSGKRKTLERLSSRVVSVSKGNKKLKKIVSNFCIANSDNIFDRVSRIIFPMMTLFFSSLYWIYYYGRNND